MAGKWQGRQKATAEGRSTPANAKSAFAGDPGAVPHKYRWSQAGVPVPQVQRHHRRGLLYPIKPEPGLIGAQPALHKRFLFLTPGLLKPVFAFWGCDLWNSGKYVAIQGNVLNAIIMPI